MENKNVGWLVLGFSVLLVFVIFLFNNAMKRIIFEGCPAVHGGYACPAFDTIAQQTSLSLGIVGVLVIIGLILIFSKQSEKIVIRKVKENIPKKEIDLSRLTPEEKQMFNIVREQRALFQAELIEQTGFGKAKVTRILDRLEGQGLVERKRRGMTNMVVLKE